jgi:pSer/pThr/pTyr-binding forkhead associated (FHA) protein
LATDNEPVVQVESDDYAAPMAPTTLLARLVLKRGGVETDISFPVHAPATVGRFDAGVGPIDIDLGSLTPEGTYISRKHAKITEMDGVFVLSDLGSSNGTFVLRSDFERVDEVELTNGLEIAFGNARFVFRLD